MIAVAGNPTPMDRESFLVFGDDPLAPWMVGSSLLLHHRSAWQFSHDLCFQLSQNHHARLYWRWHWQLAMLFERSQTHIGYEDTGRYTCSWTGQISQSWVPPAEYSSYRLDILLSLSCNSLPEMTFLFLDLLYPPVSVSLYLVSGGDFHHLQSVFWGSPNLPICHIFCFISSFCLLLHGLYELSLLNGVVISDTDTT